EELEDRVARGCAVGIVEDVTSPEQRPDQQRPEWNPADVWNERVPEEFGPLRRSQLDGAYRFGATADLERRFACRTQGEHPVYLRSWGPRSPRESLFNQLIDAIIPGWPIKRLTEISSAIVLGARLRCR